MRRRRLLVCSLLCALWPAFAPAVAAQETINYASISGRVSDATGGVVAGADVTAKQTETNVVTATVTDQSGRFRFAYLRVGTYEVVVRAKGFAVAATRVTLTVGAAFDLPIALAVGAVEATVTVSADATMLEAARSQTAGTVSQAEAQRLPLNGRNFLDLALLIPGVAPTNVGGGTQLFPETSAVPGVGLSVGSQRNLSNNFIIDGLSANDDAAALSGMSLGVDAVDQFQVVTSGGQAELGRALGGYINIVTRSGTNDLGGDGYGFFRDDRLNAKNPLLQATLPMHQNQIGFNLGGPIARDRTFFFTNAEVRRLDQSGLVTVSAANVDAINAQLAAVGYGGPPVSTGVYANPIDTTHLLAKVDRHFSGGSSMSVRYNLYDATSANARGAGGTNTPSASAALDNTDHTLAVGSVLVLSPRTVLESRAQFAHGDLAAPPSDPVGPAVNIAGVAVFGTLSSSPTGRVSRMYQAVSNLSHQMGAHAVRAGVDVLYNDVSISFPRSIRGSYAFSSLANFLAGTYNNAGFTQTFGATAVDQANPNVGVYAQDEWRVRPGLTVNAGLRYDLQYLETIATDTNNLSPRLGAVWSPFASGHTLIRASGGRFFDRVPLRALANALLSAGNTTDLANLRQIGVSLSPTQTGAPVFPNILSSVVPTTTLVNLTTMDPHLQNAYSDQIGVEVEQQVGPGRALSAGYEHTVGRRLIMSINQNVPSCAVSGSNNGCRPIAAYANNSQYSAVGRSDYHALHLSFVQRPARWGSYRVSYSWSKAMNNLGEAFFSSPIDPADLSKDWGRSDDDQRHRFVALATAALPHGLQASAMLQAYSALPFNITTGANTVQGTAARPVVNGVFIPRNAGEGSAFWLTNLRVSRTFAAGRRLHVEALVEAFNLFNHRNDIARTTVFGTGAYPSAPAAAFGQVTVVGEPRSVQFGARVRF